MTQTLLPALEILKPGKQWVCFDEEKKPISPVTLRGVSGELVEGNTDWVSYVEAVKVWRANKGKFRGVGREFIKSQNITGVDLDKCIDEQGNIASWAQAEIDRLNSYTELSPSGRGVHIWVYGSIPCAIAPNKPEPDGYEMYDSGRYFTVTGKHLPSTPTTIEDRHEEVKQLHSEIMTRRKSPSPPQEQPRQRTAEPRTREAAYAQKALDNLYMDLAATQEGARNQQLYQAAFRLGTMIGAGWINRSVVEQGLRYAATRCGLGEQETERTLRSGIGGGIKVPHEPLSPDSGYVEYKAESGAGSNGHNSNGSGPAPTDNTYRSFNLTDLGNAERLVARFGQDLRYCYDMKAWLTWNVTQWKEDKNGHAERIAKKTVRLIYKEAADVAGDDKESEARRKALASHAMRSEAKKYIRDMLELAKSEEEIPIRREDLDADPWLLNCSNGTLDLRTGKPGKHNRTDLITRCIPTAYTPGATCPLWLSFLDTIFNKDAALIRFIKRALGYALTGDTSEQCFFLLYGKGNNGKSTLLEVIQAILGEYAQSAEFRAFLSRDNEGVRNDIARMNGKRLVVAKESDKGKRLAEALVKQLTGGDTITARFLHQEYFDFKPQFKLFLAANHKPDIKGTDLGIWRRVRLIPFEVVISEAQKDKDLSRKLIQEAEGILAWLVEGCLEWQREGLGEPETVKEATAAYRNEMDTIVTFLGERCSIDNLSAEIGATALYTAYKTWCEQSGERYETQKSFSTRLMERGYEKKKTKTGVLYRGLQLLPEGEEVKGYEEVKGCEGFSDISTRSTELGEKPQKTLHNPSPAQPFTETVNDKRCGICKRNEAVVWWPNDVPRCEDCKEKGPVQG